MPAAYLPPQPQPLRILRPGPPPWWPLALVCGLLLLAGVAALCMSNSNL